MKLEIYNMAGHLIRRLHQITSSVFYLRMQDHGLEITSVQFAALSAIKARPGIDQASLAGMIAYDRATITGVIDRLEAKGFVKRSVSERDRRLREINLTEAGRNVLIETIPTVRSLQNEILMGLTEEERKTFLALAHKAALAANHLSRAPLITDDGNKAASSKTADHGV